MVRKIQLCTTIIICCFVFSLKCFAYTIDEIVKANPAFNPAITAISVKDNKTGNVLYQKNANTLIHPASTLKIITSSAAYNYLGKNYQFKTILYKNGNNVFLKVGADPLCTYQDMENLISQYKTKSQELIKNLTIDDQIIDKEPFGIGWQWDDNTNSHFPQLSPYIINHNLFTFKANIDSRNKVSIENAKEYKEQVINNLKYGQNTDITITRNIFAQNSPVFIEGTINSSKYISLPAKNPQQLYLNVLLFTLLNNNIPVNTKFKYDKVPLFSSQEAIISHNITDVLNVINTNSNNLAAEILLKHAGGVKNETTGTTKNGLELVREFYENNGLSCSNVQMVDGSGASTNDYITADFMTEALKIISASREFNTIKNSMSDYNNGTFKGRLPQLNGKLKVKTGTNANTSAVVGFMQTQSGRNITFAVLSDNLPKNVNPKEFEDKILLSIYNNY